MKAAVIDEYGDSSLLKIGDVAPPVREEGQVLIDVYASSINPIDWKIREGQMAFRYGQTFPKILGFDVSGVVAEIDEGSTFTVGQQVFGRSDVGDGGAYAEQVSMRQDTLARKPPNISHEEAAAIPLAGITALQGLRDCGNLNAGDRVLIVGASGGVGTYAIQIAKTLGAHVTAVCSGPNMDLVRSLGADDVIDYTSAPVLKGGEGYHVIYDAVGTQTVAAARESMSEAGVYLTLVPVEDVEFFVLGETERTPKGCYFVMCQANTADLAVLGGLVAAGRLTSVIDSTFPLEDIRLAHERSQTGRARGKIVLTVR